MNKQTWIIVGASSPIAKAFIECIAPNASQLILVGQDSEDLSLTANHIKIKYGTLCHCLTIDLSQTNQLTPLLDRIKTSHNTLNLFLAHTQMVENNSLTQQNIANMLNVNVKSTCLLIQCFVESAQHPGVITYLSSVAADRGRASNSLYGASKKSVEMFLQGLQSLYPNIAIIILRLGFIDTSSTYGKSGIFLARSPKACAQFCLQAIKHRKALSYFPWFWRYIMKIIKLIPYPIFKRLKV